MRSLLNTAEPIVTKTARQCLHLLQSHGLNPTAMHSSWGMAETASGVTHSDRYLSNNYDDSFAEVGSPIPGISLRIVDEQNRIVCEPTVGYLQVKGTTVTSGYYQNPEANSQLFADDGWLQTGDLGFLSEGRLTITGRAKDVIIINGKNCYSHEIEQVVELVPGVEASYTAACAIRQPNSNTDRLSIFFHTPIVEKDRLKKLLKEISKNIVHKMGIAPTYLLPVDKEVIPKTSIGKIERSQLKQRFEAGEFDSTLNQIDLLLGNENTLLATVERIEPRNETEKQLATIWKRVLRVETIKINDNFFELGGHSLLAMQILADIKEVFGVTLPIVSLFQNPTIAKLSDLVNKDHSLETIPSAITPTERKDNLPLSFTQQRLWFLDQLEGQNATYNIPIVLSLTGNLDSTCLREALKALIKRHEILRTRFTSVRGIPQQEILPLSEVALPVVNLSELSKIEQASKVTQLVRQNAQLSFDLTQAPLIRAQLLHLSHTSHILLLNIHHIVSDGWSTNIIIAELFAYYQSFSTKSPPTLPPLPIQYADFTLWQRRYLTDEALESQLEYWQNQLAGIPPTIELSTARPRPAVQTFAGSSQSFQLSPELTKQIKEIARQSGATLFMTLLAAFGVLMNRYSRQEDLVIGFPIANRNYSEVESLIGFFANTLALRIDLEGQPSFVQLLERVRRVALDAYANQDLPFDKLVEKLQPERDLSYHPIFQVMFIWQNAPYYSRELPELAVEPVELESTIAKFDLTLSRGRVKLSRRVTPPTCLQNWT